jgi:hypothetical protein
MSGARVRIAESLGEISALRAEVMDWRARWAFNDVKGAHLTQLELLVSVTSGLIEEIAARTAAIDPAAGPGVVYEACRQEDLHALHARRLWRWYADKLDQRDGSADSAQVQTLRAADEVIWSCWKSAFTCLGLPEGGGGKLPAVPIPYLAPEFSAFATPRTDPPRDLRPGRDDLLLRHIGQLPVPVIALPSLCQRRPWWLVTAAHEASHHVQFEYPGLEELTQDAVCSRALAASGDRELAEDWKPWCRELFADTCSVLLVGPAALWAVVELETRTAVRLRECPSGSYPPPLVRLAVASAVAAKAGLPADLAAFPDAAPGHGEPDWTDRLLECVPAVSGALLSLAADGARPLDTMAATTSAAYSDGTITRWRRALLGGELIPEQEVDTARFCAAASVLAWQQLARHEPDLDRAAGYLAGRVLEVLPECGEDGTRAGRAVDAAAITRQIADDLYRNGGEQ